MGTGEVWQIDRRGTHASGAREPRREAEGVGNKERRGNKLGEEQREAATEGARQ